MAELRRAGARPVFLTNNSARTPEQVAAKLRGLGIDAGPSEVMTSALATAELLAARGGGRAYVVGQDGVRRALTDAGLEVLDGEPYQADLVVVGFDGSVTYDRLKTACLLVQRGARLVATNPDASYPAEDGLWPGAGALLALITTTTGATAEGRQAGRSVFEAALRRGGGGQPRWSGTGSTLTSRGPPGSDGTRCRCSRRVHPARDRCSEPQPTTWLRTSARCFDRRP
jgi:hypothetical protein